MLIIFCEDCGSRNIIKQEDLQNISKEAILCQVCNFPISREHLIDHTGAGRVIDTSTYKLLIIDDERAYLNLLRHSLEKEYSVHTAPSGQQGLKTAMDIKPDLILLDVGMPDLNGYEVCHRLKNNRETSHIPIIFLTAHKEEEYTFKGVSLGAVDYIFKPFNLKILNAKIAVHLKNTVIQNKLQKEISEQKNTIEILRQDLLGREARIKENKPQNNDLKTHKKSNLEQEKDNLVTIINSLQHIISIQNMDKRILWANKHTMQSYGVSFLELQGEICHKFYYNRSTPCSHCHFSKETKTEQDRLIAIENENLNQKFMQTNIALYDPAGKLTGVACTAQRLHQTEKKEEEPEEKSSTALGDTLSSYYSELNKAISTILVSSDAICNMYKDDKKLAQLNDYVGEGNKHLRAIMKKMQGNLNP